MTKIDFEKIEETKEKFMTQNASICTNIKIESLFWLLSIEKNRQIVSLVIEVDNVKMANPLIEEELVMNHILYKCIRYKFACKVKQCFKYYEYGYILVYCRKNTRCKAYSGLHRTLECSQDKEQKYFLCNDAYISYDKKCDYRKKKYLKIEVVKQNIPQLYDISSKLSCQKKELLKAMRPLSK